MKKNRLTAVRPLLIAAALNAHGAVAQTDFKSSERDYLGELPVVPSVSRLPQPLDEVPGAVTVIDRNTIRRSGARELYDVLKLVPGFVVTRADGGTSMAAYHADFDSMNRRLQIFVDGRSVYSSLYEGNVGTGSLGIVLEDVERIEVLRGTNSAAYGTNAYMGVVNVVTRHAADTPGVMVSASQGGGVADRVARIGWGDGANAYRVTFSHRKDDGLANQFDDRLVDQVHFRGDIPLSSRDDLLLETGGARRRGGTGTAGDDGDPPRTLVWTSSYAHGQWKRQLAPTDELKVLASIDEERYNEAYGYYPLPSRGLGRRLALQAQYAFAAIDTLRTVVGSEYRYELVDSPDLFFEKGVQSNHFWQWFANAEWRPHPQWVVNVGGLFEHHSITGSRTSPRAMVNFHLTPDQTFRAGTTTSYRVPTLYELRGDWRVNDAPYFPYRFVQATGHAKPERLDVAEVGYLGEFRPLRLSVDARAFNELARSRMRYYGFDRALVYPGPTNRSANDVINKSPTRQRGWETQLRWKPAADTQVVLNHTVLRIFSSDDKNMDDVISAPSHYSTLMLLQRLPQDFDLSAAYTESGQMTWIRRRDMLPAYHQLDVRLAKKFRTGATSGEVALTCQALAGGHAEYYPDRLFERRTFITLRLDY